jgi:hypothetical protein
MALLQYFLEHPRKLCAKADILRAVWTEDADPTIVEHHIWELRKILDPKNPHEPLFIETKRKEGYEFLLDVERKGDLGSVQVFAKWSRERFYGLLEKLERGDEQEDEDLRIATTGFNAGVSELGLERLLNRHVRIRVIMVNPLNRPLLDARYLLRKDRTKKYNIRELNQQVSDLSELAREYPPHPLSVEPRGMIELKLSDAMPCGFVAHTKSRALLGIFVAHDSYIAGPMFEIRSESEIWETLYTDWKARWEQGHKIDPKTGWKPTDGLGSKRPRRT